MVVTLMYYPGATPTDIPAPNVQPTQRYVVTVDNATRMGTQLILSAPLVWQGETPTPNIVTVEDNATPYILWYFIDTWRLLTRETFRLTATYSAALTTLHNGIGINAVCSRFSEGDGELPSITAEPLLDSMAPYYPGQPTTLEFANNQNGVGIVVTMATDTSGRLFNNPDVPGRPVFNITTPMNSRQPEPISFLLSRDSSSYPYTFDDAIADLRLLVGAAGTRADVIQRIQIVPKYLLHTLDTETILNRPKEGEGVYVGVSGKAVVAGDSKRVYVHNKPDVDYLKAYYSGTNILIRSWGSEIATVPIMTGDVLVDFGYSLTNGLNSFLVVTNGASSPALQIPITLPDITVIGDYYTAWYNANKEQILAQGATAALSVAGAIALAVSSITPGGPFLGPAIAIGSSALSAVSTGLSLNKTMNEASRTKQVIGTSATLPYTNTASSKFLEFWSPKVPYNDRRTVCSRFGYASSRILNKLPTYDDSPRRVQCYVAGSLQTTGFKPNGVISVADHNNALSSELAAGFTIWYADVIGNYETDNYTK